MTGLRAWTRGSSLRKLSTIAGRTMAGSNSGRLAARLAALGRAVRWGLESASMRSYRDEVLDDGAERQCREEGEAADDDDHADDEADEQRRVGRERARRSPA